MVNERSQTQKAADYDSIYMTFQKKTKPQGQKIDQKLPEPWGKRGEVFVGDGTTTVCVCRTCRTVS